MIHLNHLTFHYPDGRLALNGISCDIMPGEVVALLGANGAGKSTLLGLLSGILTPDAGELTIRNLRWGSDNTFLLRQTVGMIFQNPDDQLIAPRVEDDVAFGPQNLGLTPDEVATRVDEALAALRIEHLRKRSPQRLSEGEKRLAAIAGVLAMRPELLLFDEPTSQLDPRARRELAETLEALPQTKLIATHDLGFAARLCRRVLILQNGELVRDGATQEILNDEPLMRKYGLA